MDKPKYELVNGIAETVGELIELLNKVPSDYSVSLCGMNTYGILMDTKNKTILMDDVTFIDEVMDEM